MIVMTDTPVHGIALESNASTIQMNINDYSDRYAFRLTLETAIKELVTKDVSLFVCSFNPSAILKTEKEVADLCFKHLDNSRG